MQKRLYGIPNSTDRGGRSVVIMQDMDQGPSYRCYLGAAGWDHPTWTGVFYPEDLPPEWRLAFYSTVFSCVYLSYAEWAGRDVPMLAGWVEDTSPQFRFVLEANPAGTTSADVLRLEALAPRLGPLLGDARWQPPAGGAPSGEVLWLDAFTDLKYLAGVLQQRAQPEWPVYLVGRSGRLEELNRAKVLLGLLGM